MLTCNILTDETYNYLIIYNNNNNILIIIIIIIIIIANVIYNALVTYSMERKKSDFLEQNRSLHYFAFSLDEGTHSAHPHR